MSMLRGEAMTRAACVIFLLTMVQTVIAQEDVNVLMDRAMRQAKTLKAKAAESSVRFGPDIDELRDKPGIDPAEIASRYQSSGTAIRPRDPELMVFVSTAMPEQALVMLGKQANATGAVLVFRGVKGKLNDKGAMQRMMEALAPVAKTGAQIHIDPLAFKKYSISAVPTFVITEGEDSDECQTDNCRANAAALVGDVTLDYALNVWADKQGPYREKARMFIRRLDQNADMAAQK